MTNVVRIIDEQRRQFALSLVQRCALGNVVSIREGDRTLEQNAKLWAMLNDVANAKPEGREHDPDTWKALFMQACGREVRFVMGLTGEPFPLGFRSSKLNKAQMADLITFIQQWGDEQGVEWSDASRS